MCLLFFFFNDTATTEIYTLSLHDALPIYRVAARADQGQQRPRVGHERRLDAEHEPHPLQVRLQCRAGARLDVHPGGAGELGEDEVALDVPVRGELEGLRAGAVAELLEVLGEQAVQPGQPVGAGDDEHVAVAAVDQAGALGELALLAQGAAVVRRDGPVLHRDGAGAREQGAGGGHQDSDPARSRHARHVPDSATCPTSSWKPRSAARRSAAPSSRAGSTEETSPQLAHTTCRCGCSAAW